MSDTAKPEPHPFEKLRAITKQILSVPKKEIDRRDAEWKEQRKDGRQHGRKAAGDA